MIRDISHAEQVQQRRFQAGKKGVSKAVRRFMFKAWKQGLNPGPSGYGLPADFSGCRPFDEVHK